MRTMQVEDECILSGRRMVAKGFRPKAGVSTIPEGGH
jgi:hypothetical protein